MTINGITHLIRLLLLKDMSYVLTCELLSDRNEAEFGIRNQVSGGNYHIAMLCASYVLSSLSFQRLFSKLQSGASSTHECEDCCYEGLSEEASDNIESCFQKTSTLTDNEKSFI